MLKYWREREREREKMKLPVLKIEKNPSAWRVLLNE
jgi:hypothetical protein